MLISNYQAWLQGSNRLREGGSGHPGPTPVALLLCFACENKSPQIDLNLRPRIKHKAQNDWLHNSSTSGQYLVEAPFGSSCRLGSVWTGPSQFTCLDASALSVKLRHPARTASLKSSHRFWIWLRSDFATSGQLLSCFETVSVCVFFPSQKFFWTLAAMISLNVCSSQLIFSYKSCPSPPAEMFPHSMMLPLLLCGGDGAFAGWFPEKIRVLAEEELAGTVQRSPS